MLILKIVSTFIKRNYILSNLQATQIANILLERLDTQLNYSVKESGQASLFVQNVCIIQDRL